jgi:hypothetical protein
MNANKDNKKRQWFMLCKRPIRSEMLQTREREAVRFDMSSSRGFRGLKLRIVFFSYRKKK